MHAPVKYSRITKLISTAFGKIVLPDAFLIFQVFMYDHNSLKLCKSPYSILNIKKICYKIVLYIAKLSPIPAQMA